MEVKNSSLPIIHPIFHCHYRPFWSVMIPTYNCVHYLIETLKSVLEQDPGSEQMQIEVVDDCSTKDNPEEVVREIGKGRVSFFRQPQNVGAPANFNTCIQRANGHWVHILHGDDKVLPGFYERLQVGIEKEASLGAAFCRYLHMDENGFWQILSPVERETPGVLSNFLPSLAIVNRIMTPSIVVKRSVYEKLGGFNLELFHSADWDMWKRIAVNYSLWYEPQLLACYREHSGSDTSKLTQSGANIREACRAIEIAQSYLPHEIAIEISNKAREHHAFKAIHTAYRVIAKGDQSTAIAQIRAALKCSHSPKVMEALLNLLKQVTTNSDDFSLLPFSALDQFLAEYQALSSLHEEAARYQQERTNKSVIDNLRHRRKEVALKWLNLPSGQLGEMYLGDLGKAHKILINSGINNEILTDFEQNFVDKILENLSEQRASSDAINNLLAAMLYFIPDKLPIPYTESQIPDWFLNEYIDLVEQQKLSIDSLKLKNINYIVFPDWSQSEESLSTELANLVRVIATHPNRSQIALLIDTTNIAEEEADIMLSAVAMHLIIEKNLEIDEETTISLLGKLTRIQWETLLSRLDARIVLENEDSLAIKQANAEKIISCTMESLKNKQVLQMTT